MASIMIDQIRKDVQNIYCVARNYVKHIEELKNEIPEEPPIFMKPNSSILQSGGTIMLPPYSQDVHYEVEVVVYIKQNANYIAPEEAMSAIGGYGIGLDLTARDVQSFIKEKGYPWLKAKGFRHSACLSNFVDPKMIADPTDIDFTLEINGELRQKGNTSHMISPIATIVSMLSNHYGLQEGDIIFTGTPEGIGKLNSKDSLELKLSNLVEAKFNVA